jgi:hypothetical protein
MITHSTVPARGVPKSCAIDGRPMFTMDESSVVMKAAEPDSASTIHLLARSSVITSARIVRRSAVVPFVARE